MKRDFITLLQRTPEELKALIQKGIALKNDRRRGVLHEELKNKNLAMIFEKSSTRTRISFEVGMRELGGNPLFLSSKDIQLGRGETIKDTARVMSRYVQGIIIRTFGEDRVEELAKYASVPVINALTDTFHPCQIMADVMTIYEHFGGIQGIKVAYIGDGNNMANSWINGCVQFGMELSIASPKNYTVDSAIYENAVRISGRKDARVSFTDNPVQAVQNANVIYTDVWASMGQEGEQEKRLKDFKGFCVTKALMDSAAKDAVFMHCLPAHRGEEVAENVLESDRSLVFDEAENRLHIQKAILLDCLGGN